MRWIDSVQRKVLGTKYGSKGDYFGEKGISPPHICGASIFCRTGDYYSYENMKSDPNSFFAFDPFEHWFSRSELRELHNVLHSRRNPYFNLEHMRPVLELLGTFIEEEHYNPNLDDILIARNYYSSIQDKPEFSHQIIKGNTLRFGPYYNAIAQNGLPVLGEYVEQYVDATHPNHLRPLNSKITHFIGLIGTPNGGIDFDFGAKDGKPVTITEEDIDVSLVLAFAYDKPLDVTIDMASRSHLSFFSTDIQEKVFEPVWLAETDIGKTSFITDFLAGRFAWHADQFEIGKGASNHSRQKAQDLIQKILSVPSNDPSDKVSIVNINPAFVKLDVGVIDCPNDTNLIGIRVAEVKIQIDGGYTHDTTSRDWHHRNDLRFSHPQITKILTDEFNLIAQLVPVFERFRQCVALSNALTLLRQKGFEPNASLSAHIQEKREEFENRIAGKPPEYAIPIPFFYKPEVK
jgi:hypothetical protein